MGFVSDSEMGLCVYVVGIREFVGLCGQIFVGLSRTGLIVPPSIPKDFIWPPSVEAEVKWGFWTGL